MQLRKIQGSSLATEVDGELVMIHADTGRFFALRDVGLAVWQALDSEHDLDAITSRLAADYAVDAETCRADVTAFAAQLVEAGFAEYA